MTKTELIDLLEKVDDNAEIVIIDEEIDSELSLQNICSEDKFITIFVKQVS